MTKKGKAASRHEAHSTPPHADSRDLAGAQEENPGGFHTFLVSWVSRRGKVSSIGHRKVSRWVWNTSREGDSRPSLSSCPRALPLQKRSQTLLLLPSRHVGTSGTSCSPALATNTPQETQPCPSCLQLSMPHLKI